MSKPIASFEKYPSKPMAYALDAVARAHLSVVPPTETKNQSYQNDTQKPVPARKANTR